MHACINFSSYVYSIFIAMSVAKLDFIITGKQQTSDEACQVHAGHCNGNVVHC